MKDYLTDLELEKIEALCKDEAMYEAVRKVLLAQVYYSGALKKGENLNLKTKHIIYWLPLIKLETKYLTKC